MNLQTNHSLKSYTTYQIGGVADFFVEAKTEAELLEALNWAEQNHQKVFVFGGGSNLIFADEGFRGLVVRVRMDQLKITEDDSLKADGRHGDVVHVEAGAGLRITDLVKAAAEAGLTGLESWNGLPGTVGGAVRGNAGCFGVECKDLLQSVRIWKDGKVEQWSLEGMEYAYRESKLKREGGVVLSAVFTLLKGEPERIAEKMKEIVRLRIQKQPPGLSTGSFFKNPNGDHAGRLIEAAGCKGLRVGGAEISMQHANFLVNKGGATAADVLALSQDVMQRVERQFGVQLEPEVMIVKA